MSVRIMQTLVLVRIQLWDGFTILILNSASLEVVKEEVTYSPVWQTVLEVVVSHKHVCKSNFTYGIYTKPVRKVGSIHACVYGPD